MHHFCFFSDISIHSLRMEGDSKENIVSSPFRKFQSTPSAWRETLLLPFFLFSRSHFNPLPPHGGRPVLTSILRSNPAFQSTPSAWRETEIVPTLRLSKYISIHSLRMEGDVSFLLRFQSMCISIHSLRMEGDYKIVLNGTYGISISIHSLRMEGDI